MRLLSMRRKLLWNHDWRQEEAYQTTLQGASTLHVPDLSIELMFFSHCFIVILDDTDFVLLLVVSIFIHYLLRRWIITATTLISFKMLYKLGQWLQRKERLVNDSLILLLFLLLVKPLNVRDKVEISAGFCNQTWGVMVLPHWGVFVSIIQLQRLITSVTWEKWRCLTVDRVISNQGSQFVIIMTTSKVIDLRYLRLWELYFLILLLTYMGLL